MFDFKLIAAWFLCIAAWFLCIMSNAMSNSLGYSSFRKKKLCTYQNRVYHLPNLLNHIFSYRFTLFFTEKASMLHKFVSSHIDDLAKLPRYFFPQNIVTNICNSAYLFFIQKHTERMFKSFKNNRLIHYKKTIPL